MSMRTGYGEYVVRVDLGMRPGDDYVDITVTTTSEHNARTLARAMVENARHVRVRPSFVCVMRFLAKEL